MQRRLKVFAFLVTAAFLLAACGQSKPAAPAAPQTSQPQATQPQATQPQASTPAAPKTVKKIKFANAVTPPNMVHLPAYVAKDHGFFEAEGLDVEIISLEGGVGTARAVASKSADVAGTSADPLIAQAAAGGAQLVAVYSYAPRVTNAMIGGAAVKKPADLKGKKMGVQEKNAFADVQTRVVLATNGVKESEVTFVSTSTAGRLPNLLEGKTDTAILHVDQVHKALKENPNLNYVVKLWEADPDWWYSAFIVHTDTLKNDPDVVERFVRAIIKSTRWMYQNKDKVVETALKYNKGFDRAIYEKTYDDLVKGRQWPVNEGISRQMVEHTIKKQMELGILKAEKPPTFEQIVDMRIVEKVLKELGKQGDGL